MKRFGKLTLGAALVALTLSAVGADLRLPSGSVGNREISNTDGNQIEASKLWNLDKDTERFGKLVSGGRTCQIGTRAKVGATSGFVVGAADNLPYVATLPASQTGSTLVIPIDGLAIGDMITGFRVVAQVESAGGAVTIDGDLRATTNVAADPTDASIGTMTQVSVSADTAVSQAKTGLTEAVASGKTYYLKITATTAGSTDIVVQACEISVTNAAPVTEEVTLFIADKAGYLTEDVAAACVADGSSGSTTFTVKKNGSSILTGAITVSSSTGDGVQVAGTYTDLAARSYVAGDRISCAVVESSHTGAQGPMLNYGRLERGD